MPPIPLWYLNQNQVVIIILEIGNITFNARKCSLLAFMLSAKTLVLLLRVLKDLSSCS